MQHANHIYEKAYGMGVETMCAYKPPQHGLSQWKCQLRCCAHFPHIDLPCHESDRHNSNTSLTIRFNVYHIIARCIVHWRGPLDENKICLLCLQDPASMPPAKVYIKKDLAMMETSIADFHTNFYITAIQKLSFHIPHVHILGTHHCVNTRHKTFKAVDCFKMYCVVVIIPR